LKIANATSLSALRQLPTQALQLANAAQIFASAPFGTFTYGPAVDGALSPALPGQLFLAGKFDKEVSILQAHNTVEGFLFTDPRFQTSPQFNSFVAQSFPEASPAIQSLITDTLYPADFSGAFGYKTPFERAVVAVS